MHIQNNDADTTTIKNVKFGILCAAISACLFGFTPVIVKTVQYSGVSTSTVAFVRNFTCIFFAFFWSLMQKQSLKIDKKTFCKITGLAVVGPFGATLTLYASYQYISIGTATVLHFLYPALAALFAYMFFKDKINRNKLIGLCLSCVGLLFFMQFGAGNAQLGFIYAVASAVTFALYIISLEKSGFADMSTSILVFYLSIVTSILMLIYGFLTDQLTFFAFTPYTLLLTCLVGFLTSFLATALLQLGVRHLNAVLAAIICLLEPISGLISGQLFLKESMSTNEWIGSIIIIVALLISIKPEKRKPV